MQVDARTRTWASWEVKQSMHQLAAPHIRLPIDRGYVHTLQSHDCVCMHGIFWRGAAACTLETLLHAPHPVHTCAIAFEM